MPERRPRIVVAPVRTMDPERPEAEAILVAGDRIAAVGSLGEVRAAAPEGAA
jgi:predicted amidohydrolase YtcJ